MFKFLKGMFSKFNKEAEALSEDAISDDSGKVIKESKLDELLWNLEIGLMESDVAVEVIEELKVQLKTELLGKRVKRSADFQIAVNNAIKTSLQKILTTATLDFDDYIQKKEKPVVIMFVGVNGTGKTTAIAKIAHRLIGVKKSVVLAAGDTFRAGAIEQLTLHSEKLGVKIIKHQAGADSAAVAYDAIEHAKARYKDVVLVDTAGRMQTNTNLMDEMKKIKRIAQPDLVIFVGDSLAGNDAVEQARKFDEAIGIDAIILTKIDADAKGGAALSITHAVKKPIIFVSTGQEYEQFAVFDAKWMIDRIFD
ncbi:MAG: signal recognition particle-docking protein FtsY [Candidatus Thermoplasmatota archaeon]|nr:signal recognition particle-docking protein FtsY [Euryarchaeota archaeon]MBU4031723.1 signal recognition particle-docking protein FtsY [Candidatus Thermoplasmatota archaeon]MBU4070751.1 signal recognition particle-docking protein FtsY [Candidatus Thermoplasmatota archaeon]MBU4144740.1 signal recognition particle-docking protein FtsY [Candidatus Thermoplasmatota archaeon]MBU4592842.1 signal recognition particle-docking protein FtsY [Candidatus Thermoplasmatota archaeon]